MTNSKNVKLYNQLNPLHWIVTFFSNSRKNDYLKPGLHVDETKATQRILYWFRNLVHDFMSYIIGFEDDPEFITVKENDKDTFSEWLDFCVEKIEICLFAIMLCLKEKFNFILNGDQKEILDLN